MRGVTKLLIHIRWQKWLKRLKFLLLFLVLTILIQRMVMVWIDWIDPHSGRQEPKSYAIKVIGEAHESSEEASMLERLKLFFWFGQ